MSDYIHNHGDPVTTRSRIDTASLPSDGGDRFNRLIFEKSPYLLQHAENPIAWRPWGDEAFAAAQAEDKPVFLSVGYSTCHWCHVMAEECFEDEEVAALLNRSFIAIKVDREERPDIDSDYMAVCQMMTGSGGWPLTLVLTPQKLPFFAATYLPKHTGGNMPGLIPLLEKIEQIWTQDRSALLQTGREARDALIQLTEERKGHGELDEDLFHKAYRQFEDNYDRQHGGFGPAPKFPSPHGLSLLLRIWRRTGDPAAKSMALHTLRKIRLGGLFDQLGFGLHRYSVDEHWLVPHFEKMLYDQALCAIAYLEAFQASGDDFFARTAREILTYMMRDLGDDGGGFHCGEDADSQGSEGTYYLWSPEEIIHSLEPEEGEIFCRCYNITESGHLDGKSIPHLTRELPELAGEFGLEPAELGQTLSRARKKLEAERLKRPRPHRDDKLLASWNGLAIAAMARGASILAEPIFMERAGKAADFLLTNMQTADGRLLRRWRLGEAAVAGFLDDYAYLAWGLLELFLAGGDSRYLRRSLALTETMMQSFSDGRGGFYDSGEDQQDVLSRGRTLQDGALPAGGSVAAFNLLRLGRLTGRRKLEERGKEYLRSHTGQVDRYPTAYAQFLIALDYAFGENSEIVLCRGDGKEAFERLCGTVYRRFLPGTLVVRKKMTEGRDAEIVPLLKGKVAQGRKETVYLCRGHHCLEPATGEAELERLLKQLDRAP